MKIGFRLLCVLVLLLGLVSFSQSRWTQDTKSDDDSDSFEVARSFVVTSIESRVSTDGAVKLTGSRTRYVRANGDWRLVLHGPKGSVNPPSASEKGSTGDVVYASSAEGVFAKAPGSDHRRSVSKSADENMLKHFRSHYLLRSHPEFVRTDEICGLKVYVHRVEGSGYWLESSYSPKTGMTPLRTVAHLDDGSEVRIEAIKVEFTEVPDDLNEDLKTLPVKPKQEN